MCFRQGRNGFYAGLTAGFGGAFEYDGGSDDPINLVKIVFIEVVFDHNAASGSVAAVAINGRNGMTGLDPNIQNWESGIELTVLGSTFFRNFCSFLDAALSVFDVWPLVATMTDTDFVRVMSWCVTPSVSQS